MAIKGIFFAVQAGTFAALASISAKLVTSSTAALSVTNLFSLFLEGSHYETSMSMERVSLGLRFFGVATMFLCNALMWTMFTKSMHLCSSVLEATAFNVASNFLSTAYLSSILFGEQVSVQWYIGSVFVLIGLIILHKGSSTSSSHGDVDQGKEDQQQQPLEYNPSSLKMKQVKDLKQL